MCHGYLTLDLNKKPLKFLSSNYTMLEVDSDLGKVTFIYITKPDNHACTTSYATAFDTWPNNHPRTQSKQVIIVDKYLN